MPSLKRCLNVDVMDEESDDEGGAALIGILQKVNIYVHSWVKYTKPVIGNL